MRYTLVFMLFVISIAFSGTVSQTDWSGGAGVQGPVLDWSDAFYSTDGISSVVDGIIKLALNPITPVEHVIASDLSTTLSICSFDRDNDGDLDIFCATAGFYMYSGCNNDGTGTSWYHDEALWTLPPASRISSADIDNDGFVDLVGCGRDDPYLYFYKNTHPQLEWIAYTIDGGLGTVSVYSADINGDGDMDVLAGNYAEIIWWENADGTGTSWTEHTIDGDFYGAEPVYAVDVDDDGDMDVLGASGATDGIAWWENTNGTGTTWTEHTIDGSLNQIFAVYSADIDGDGDMDVLGGAMGSVTWWENTNGTGTSWTEHLIDGSLLLPLGVNAADVDDDGDMDVLIADTNNTMWWENTDGTGTAWTKHDLGSGDCAVCPADIDGNGVLDIVGDGVSWWKVQEYSSDGTLESSILDTDRLPEWDEITYTSTIPAGTSVGFQVRSSDNSADMGIWSDPIYTSGTSLNGILDDSTRYVQYRVTLETTDPSYSASLEDVSLSFIELITVLTPNEYTVWTQEQEDVVISWDYEADKSLLRGESVSIDLYKGGSLIANLSGGDVPDTGAFTYPGPIPTGWVPGLDYYVVITDNLDNYGSGDLFEIRAFTATEDMSATAIFSAELLPFSPNPVRGLVSASIAVPESDIVNLSVYDITGRMIRSSSGAIDAGYHSIELGELNQGIYFCRMVTEDYTNIQKFVVIE